MGGVLPGLCFPFLEVIFFDPLDWLQGAFELGATVCPVAIKYNKLFVDAFWNSKRVSFTRYLAGLMCSWALVCDVYFLEPQNQRRVPWLADLFRPHVCAVNRAMSLMRPPRGRACSV